MYKTRNTNLILLISTLLTLISCGNSAEVTQGPAQEDIVTYLSTQEGSMPEMMGATTIADMVIAAHEEFDGSTIHFRWGDLGGLPLYVVSIFPDLGIIREGKNIDKTELIDFINLNYELFLDPRVALGTWYNPDDGNTYIDINVVLSEKEQALALGEQYNQIAIFNLETFEEISTGGNGQPIENLPKPKDRLPKF